MPEDNKSDVNSDLLSRLSFWCRYVKPVNVSLYSLLFSQISLQVCHTK